MTVIADAGHAEVEHFTTVFLFVIALFLCGRVGAIVERWGFPSVLGELTAGILLANAAIFGGIDAILHLRDDALVKIFPFVGVVLLLFKCGLEEQLQKMMQVGGRAFLVAFVGMVVPGCAGWVLSQWLFPDANSIVHIFVGATLVATSVGITAKIFTDLGYGGPTKSLVIGAAVIDDVGGLIVLAVVAVMAAGGDVTVGMVAQTAGGAVLFLVGAVVIGTIAAPAIGRFLSRIHTGVGMKTGMALLFCGVFSYAAVVTVGLEPIVGAFAAGLILEPVHFRTFVESHQVQRLQRWIGMLDASQTQLRKEMEVQQHAKEHGHVESLIEGFARFFIPVFFVHTGMGVDLRAFGSLQTVGIALVIAVVAMAGKLACGLVAGRHANKWVTGWAMMARGEVGLVFANIALSKGVFSAEHFAVMTVVVVLTTFVPPLVLPMLIRREKATSAGATVELAVEAV